MGFQGTQLTQFLFDVHYDAHRNIVRYNDLHGGQRLTFLVGFYKVFQLGRSVNLSPAFNLAVGLYIQHNGFWRLLPGPDLEFKRLE